MKHLVRTRAWRLPGSASTRLYLAYGSNLQVAAMVSRCPGAKPYLPIALCGWSLRLPLLANIEPDPSPGAAALCALYRVEDEDIEALDRFEDAAPSGHGLYTRINLHLEAIGQAAFAYVLTETERDGPSAASSWCERHFGGERSIEAARRSYVSAIEQGYEDWGFPLARLLAADRLGWRERQSPRYRTSEHS